MSTVALAMDIILGSKDTDEICRVVNALARMEAISPDYAESYAIGTLAAIIAKLNDERGIQ